MTMEPTGSYVGGPEYLHSGENRTNETPRISQKLGIIKLVNLKYSHVLPPTARVQEEEA